MLVTINGLKYKSNQLPYIYLLRFFLMWTEGLMLKLKLQYFGHLMRTVDSLEKTLMLGGIGGRRRRGWQRMRWLDGITDAMDITNFGRWWGTGRPGVLQSMGSQGVRHDWATEQQQFRNNFHENTQGFLQPTPIKIEQHVLCNFKFGRTHSELSQHK